MVRLSRRRSPAWRPGDSRQRELELICLSFPSLPFVLS